MKRTLLAVLSLLLAPALFADSGQRLIPAGSLVSCTTGDAKISSKTAAVGDPVLCKVAHRRGDFMLPYGSYLGGEFSEYKDPGHLVGKGWMLLEFDRLYVGNQVYPLDAKVVNVPGYGIDKDGRIQGKGHPVRDTITWMIPILWPIDLINLPRRGPKPTLKAETQLTLRVMDDVEVPIINGPERDPYGLIPRGSSSYSAPPSPAEDPAPAPQVSYNQPQPAPVQPPDPPPAPQVVTYVQQVPVPYAVPMYPAPVVVAYPGMLVAPRMAMYGYTPPAYYVQPYGTAYYPQPYGAAYYAPPYNGAYYAPRAYAPRPAYGSPGYGYGGAGYNSYARAAAPPVSRAGYRYGY